MPFRAVDAHSDDLAMLTSAFNSALAAIAARSSMGAITASERDRLRAIILRIWRSTPNSDLVLPAVDDFLGDRPARPADR